MSIAEGVFSTGKLTHCRQVKNNQQATLCVTEVIHLCLQPLAINNREVGGAWGFFGKQRKRFQKGGMKVHFWIYRYMVEKGHTKGFYNHSKPTLNPFM